MVRAPKSVHDRGSTRIQNCPGATAHQFIRSNSGSYSDHSSSEESVWRSVIGTHEMSSHCLFSSQGLPSGSRLSLSQGPPPCQRQRPYRASINRHVPPPPHGGDGGSKPPGTTSFQSPVFRLSPPVFPKSLPAIFPRFFKPNLKRRLRCARKGRFH